jgi:DNA primase
LIDAIALLHQHQRPIKTMQGAGQLIEYVEVTAQDISQANEIAHEVLGRSLDELPPQTRRLLASVVEYVRGQAKVQAVPKAEVRFTRRDVREATGWGDTQLRVHLTRLHELEYLLAHHGKRGQSFEYELVFDGDSGQSAPHLVGLIDADDLALDLGAHMTTTASSRGQTPQFAALTRGQNGPIAAPSRVNPSVDKPALARVLDVQANEDEQTHALRPNGKHPSYVVTPSLAASLATPLAAEVHP